VGSLLAKRGVISATGLRGRPVTGAGSKADIVAEVVSLLWPLVESGAVAPIVQEILPIERAGDAHRAVDGGPFGKVLLQIR
jgi:NADPH:quinone reductase-like Zn-dependent oxidoreductase